MQKFLPVLQRTPLQDCLSDPRRMLYVTSVARMAIIRTGVTSLSRHVAKQEHRHQACRERRRRRNLPTALRTPEPVQSTAFVTFINHGGSPNRAVRKSAPPETAAVSYTQSLRRHTRQRRQRQVAKRNSRHVVRLHASQFYS